MVDEMDKPKVGIVILHWKNFDDTCACLESVSKLTYAPINVIFVDDNSNDFSIDEVKTLLPSSTIIRSESNLGYTGGNNLGI